MQGLMTTIGRGSSLTDEGSHGARRRMSAGCGPRRARPPIWDSPAMTVRKATSEDAEQVARVFAAAAEEGWIAAEPPVDVAARAEQFRALACSSGPAALFVLEDGGRIVGLAGVSESTAPGV